MLEVKNSELSVSRYVSLPVPLSKRKRAIPATSTSTPLIPVPIDEEIHIFLMWVEKFGGIDRAKRILAGLEPRTMGRR